MGSGTLSSVLMAWVSSMCERGNPTRRGPGPEAWEGFGQGAQINSDGHVKETKDVYSEEEKMCGGA